MADPLLDAIVKLASQLIPKSSGAQKIVYADRLIEYAVRFRATLGSVGPSRRSESARGSDTMVKITRAADPGGASLAVSNVQALNATESTVQISWLVNRPASGQVEYGLSAGVYTQTSTLETDLLTGHVQSLAGLTPDTTYHYRVHSVDALGEHAYSPNLTFSTTASTIEEFFPPPVTTNTVTVPTSIAFDGSVDVVTQLESFIAGQPNGTKFVFQLNGVYRINRGLLIVGRSNLVFDLNGATIRSYGGEAIPNSPFYFNGGDSDIMVMNGTLQGSSPTPGVYGGGEHQHGVAIRGGTRFTIKNVTMRALYGDGLYVAVGATWIWMYDSTVESCGRMGIAIVSGSDIMVERCEFGLLGYGWWDCEPNAGGIVNRVTFRDSHCQRITLPVVANAFFFGGNATVATGTQVNDVLVQNNVIDQNALICSVIMADVRRRNIQVIGNRSLTTRAGPVMRFEHVDGLVVTGNTQPLSSGSLVFVNDCPGAITSPNP